MSKVIYGTRETQEAQFYADLEAAEGERREVQLALALQPTAEARAAKVIVFPGKAKP